MLAAKGPGRTGELILSDTANGYRGGTDVDSGHADRPELRRAPGRVELDRRLGRHIQLRSHGDRFGGDGCVAVRRTPQGRVGVGVVPEPSTLPALLAAAGASSSSCVAANSSVAEWNEWGGLIEVGCRGRLSPRSPDLPRRPGSLKDREGSSAGFS